MGLRFYLSLIPLIFRFALTQLRWSLISLHHRLTYTPPSQSSPPRTVLIIGGSFAGLALARRLSHSVPSHTRVLVVEPHTHLHYAFAFPRYSVVSGHEAKAFVPYSGLISGAPRGALEVLRGEVVEVRSGSLRLGDGQELPFAALAIATGAVQPVPARLGVDSKAEGMSLLRRVQGLVKDAGKIAVVGGGAVGVELAADVKSWYQEKEVVLVHSRERLLPRFEGGVHEMVMRALGEVGVEVMLGERPVVPVVEGGLVAGRTTLEFHDGKREFDLVIPCTGLKPNSHIVADYAPKAIAPSGEILVDADLRVRGVPDGNIFALGDVAATGGAKMARAGLVQADVVATNILHLLDGRKNMEEYAPQDFEGALKLTAGKDKTVLYAKLGNAELLKEAKGEKEDMDAARAWKFFGVKMTDPEI